MRDYRMNVAMAPGFYSDWTTSDRQMDLILRQTGYSGNRE